MKHNTSIRKSTLEDLTELKTLYKAAFPEEDLLPLVTELITNTEDMYSLVAEDDHIQGHIVSTICATTHSTENVALLGPVAVAPDAQRQGIGSSLINRSIEILKTDHISKICVLGDPLYYGRFGFKTETAISTPYPLPEAWTTAWQSLELSNDVTVTGTLIVPTAWQHPTLWSE
jgi:putative acetyltransferase